MKERDVRPSTMVAMVTGGPALTPVLTCLSGPQSAHRTGSDVRGSHSGHRPSDVCVEAQHELVCRRPRQDRLPAGHMTAFITRLHKVSTVVHA